jgi:HK97 family phage prohead protease
MGTDMANAPGLTLPDLILVRNYGVAPQLSLRDDVDPDSDDETGPAGTNETEADDPSDADDVLGLVEGHFSVFNSWYQINSWWEGEFLEQVLPGSFAKTFAERGTSGTGNPNKIVSNFDHGFDPTIGDKILGPFTLLSEDKIGGAYAFELLDTSYNRDLMPALKRGLYGSSFRFQVIKDAWNMEPGTSDWNPNGIPERSLQELRVFELGPVTYPASPTASSGMRSGTDAFYEALRNRDPERVDKLRGRVQTFRTAAHRPAAAGTGDTAAAPHDTNEPASRHSGGLSHAQRRLALYPSLRSTQ